MEASISNKNIMNVEHGNYDKSDVKINEIKHIASNSLNIAGHIIKKDNETSNKKNCLDTDPGNREKTSVILEKVIVLCTEIEIEYPQIENIPEFTESNCESIQKEDNAKKDPVMMKRFSETEVADNILNKVIDLGSKMDSVGYIYTAIPAGKFFS